MYSDFDNKKHLFTGKYLLEGVRDFAIPAYYGDEKLMLNTAANG
jgi:hypothetical protein